MLESLTFVVRPFHGEDAHYSQPMAIALILAGVLLTSCGRKTSTDSVSTPEDFFPELPAIGASPTMSQVPTPNADMGIHIQDQSLEAQPFLNVNFDAYLIPDQRPGRGIANTTLSISCRAHGEQSVYRREDVVLEGIASRSLVEILPSQFLVMAMMKARLNEVSQQTAATPLGLCEYTGFISSRRGSTRKIPLTRIRIQAFRSALSYDFAVAEGGVPGADARGVWNPRRLLDRMANFVGVRRGRLLLRCDHFEDSIAVGNLNLRDYPHLFSNYRRSALNHNAAEENPLLQCLIAFLDGETNRVNTLAPLRVATSERLAYRLIQPEPLSMEWGAPTVVMRIVEVTNRSASPTQLSVARGTPGTSVIMSGWFFSPMVGRSAVGPFRPWPIEYDFTTSLPGIFLGDRQAVLEGRLRITSELYNGQGVLQPPRLPSTRVREEIDRYRVQLQPGETVYVIVRTPVRLAANQEPPDQNRGDNPHRHLVWFREVRRDQDFWDRCFFAGLYYDYRTDSDRRMVLGEVVREEQDQEPLIINEFSLLPAPGAEGQPFTQATFNVGQLGPNGSNNPRALRFRVRMLDRHRPQGTSYYSPNRIWMEDAELPAPSFFNRSSRANGTAPQWCSGEY